MAPAARGTLRSFWQCMQTDRDYILRAVSGAEAARRVRALAGGSLLHGRLAELEAQPYVWEVLFTGASRRHPPSGVVGGFLAADGRFLAAVRWPEG